MFQRAVAEVFHYNKAIRMHSSDRVRDKNYFNLRLKQQTLTGTFLLWRSQVECARLAHSQRVICKTQTSMVFWTKPYR